MLSQEEEARLVSAIRRAEEGHRAEIVVHFARRCAGDPVAAARDYASKLPRTKDDTTVVLYVASSDKKVSVYAGAGVYGAGEPTFWQSVTDAVAERAKQGDVLGGVVEALGLLQPILSLAAPGKDTAGNELADRATSDGDA
ncbi:MAG: TPM domain-containing protein [Polyangiaceae bacterium]